MGRFPVEHSERIPKFFDFVLRGVFFALDLFEGLEDFVDVIEGFFQFVADLLHLFDGLMDACGRPVVGTGFNRFGLAGARAGIASSTRAARAAPEGWAPGAVTRTVLRGS